MPGLVFDRLSEHVGGAAAAALTDALLVYLTGELPDLDLDAEE